MIGKPLVGAEVRCWARRIQSGKAGHSRIVTLEDDFPLAEVRTDKEGRFRIEGLAVGLRYGLVFVKENYVRHIDGGDPEDLTIKIGETKDLGDHRLRPVGE